MGPTLHDSRGKTHDVQSADITLAPSFRVQEGVAQDDVEVPPTDTNFRCSLRVFDTRVLDSFDWAEPCV